MEDIKIAVIDTNIDINCTQLNLNKIEIHNRYCSDRQEQGIHPKGHGTAVCGIIQKYVPHANIVLFPVSSIDDSSILVDILNYIYETRICKIVNLSLGFFNVGAKTTELRVICEKLYSIGIVIVSAYDNQGLMSYPACFDEVIGVDTSKDVKGDTFIWVEGSPINVICSSEKKRVLWENGNKVFVKGNSFSVPFISSIIAKKCSSENETLDIKNILKNQASRVQVLPLVNHTNKNEKSIKINRAIIFPVNDDTMPILVFQNDCGFEIAGVYDYIYSSKIGKKTSNFFNCTVDHDFNIQSFDDIKWETNFDTIILGKVDDVQNSLQDDIIHELLFNCRQYGKAIYLLDDNIYELLDGIESKISQPLNPMIEYPYMLLEKKWVNSTFTICVAGSGTDEDKLFLQLQLKRIISDKGYKVGYLSTHKSGYLLGADKTFPYNKKQFDVINEKDKSFILNNLVHEIELKNPDVIITGILSEVIPSNVLFPNSTVFVQGTFLYTIQPSVIIMVVSLNDNIKLIMRNINFFQSAVERNIVCIVVSPTKASFRNGLTYTRNLSGSIELASFIEKVNKETGITTVELNEKSMVKIEEACLKHVIRWEG